MTGGKGHPFFYSQDCFACRASLVSRIAALIHRTAPLVVKLQHEI